MILVVKVSLTLICSETFKTQMTSPLRRECELIIVVVLKMRSKSVNLQYLKVNRTKRTPLQSSNHTPQSQIKRIRRIKRTLPLPIAPQRGGMERKTHLKEGKNLKETIELQHKPMIRIRAIKARHKNKFNNSNSNSKCSKINRHFIIASHLVRLLKIDSH